MSFSRVAFLPFFIFTGDPLIPAFRGEVLVSSLTLEASVTAVVGIGMPRLRFMGIAADNDGTSSISKGPGEPREDSEELSSSFSSACLTARP